jgi:hypothetical protein
MITDAEAKELQEECDLERQRETRDAMKKTIEICEDMD